MMNSKINLHLRTHIFLAALLFLTGCASMASRKSAIQSVFEQRTQLKEKYGELGMVNGQLLSGLKAIDVRNCPPDFRAAWFDYLVESEALDTRIKRIGMLATGEGKAAGDLPSLIKLVGTDPTAGKYLIESLEKVDDAWGKLERTAMQYNVVPER